MAYTILSAAYANPEKTAALIITKEVAAKVVSLADTPDIWSEMLAWGEPAEYEAPTMPVPSFISDRQFAQCLAARGLITEQEAEDWVGPGTVPLAILSLVNALPAADRFAARMLLRGATRFERSHPLVEQIGSLMTPPWTLEQLDAFWKEAASL